MVLGCVIGGLIIAMMIAVARSRVPDSDTMVIKKAYRILENNKWSLLIRPVDGDNIYGIITDRWKKEHNISGRMRDRGHIVSLVGDEEWDEWLDYYNPKSGYIDTLLVAEGKAVVTMAMTRNLDDTLKDIKWFIPRVDASELKARADYSTALEGRLHNAERDLEDVDSLRRVFHRDRKKLQSLNRMLNTENDTLNKQINEITIINSNLEREVIELRNWKEFGQRFLLSEKRGIKDAADFLTTSLQDASSDHLLMAAEHYDKLNTKMPPINVQGKKVHQQGAQQVKMQEETTEPLHQLEKKEEV